MRAGGAGEGAAPLLFLDVDGVLNPYAMTGPAPGAYGDFEEHEARGFVLRLSRAMGRRLAQLPAELCWATTWADTIDRDVSPYCGLPGGLRVAAWPPADGPEALVNWKLVQIRRLVESEVRPFVWVDDDALSWPGPDGADAYAWSAGLALPHLLLSPDPAKGLTEEEIGRIAGFLESTLRAPSPT